MCATTCVRANFSTLVLNRPEKTSTSSSPFKNRWLMLLALNMSFEVVARIDKKEKVSGHVDVVVKDTYCMFPDLFWRCNEQKHNLHCLINQYTEPWREMGDTEKEEGERHKTVIIPVRAKGEQQTLNINAEAEICIFLFCSIVNSSLTQLWARSKMIEMG